MPRASKATKPSKKAAKVGLGLTKEPENYCHLCSKHGTEETITWCRLCGTMFGPCCASENEKYCVNCGDQS